MVATGKLGKQDWLDEGMRVLAGAGHPALRPEKMARSLGVSRGSFYWHFRDVADFHAALLARCEDQIVDRPYRDAERTSAAGTSEMLGALIDIAFGQPPVLDRALFNWAPTSELAAAAVERIGRRRIELLKTGLEATGLEAGTASKRAAVLYWTYLGRCLAPGFDPGSGVVGELRGIFLGDG